MKLTQKKINKALSKVEWPECHLKTEYIDPNILVFNPMARLKCQNCGLYNRVPKCSPSNPPMDVIEKKLKSFKTGIIVVYQSDGTKAWRPEQERPNKPLEGKQLKGTAAGMARFLNYSLHDVTKWLINKYDLVKDEDIITLISGHCQICGKCCLKDKYESVGVVKKCTKGYSSLEAIGIDCFKLLEAIGVKHEVVPWNCVTVVGGIFV